MRTRRARVEIMTDTEGNWQTVATCSDFGDAAIIAQAMTARAGNIGPQRIYRAIQSHPSGGSLDYLGRIDGRLERATA